MFDQQLIRKRIKQLRADLLTALGAKEPTWHQWAAELVDLQDTFPEHSDIDFHDAAFLGWDGKTDIVVEDAVVAEPKLKKAKDKPMKVASDSIKPVYGDTLEQYQTQLQEERAVDQNKPTPICPVQPRKNHFINAPIMATLTIKPIDLQPSSKGTAIVVDAREIHNDIISTVVQLVPEDERFEMYEATLLAYMAYVRGDIPLLDTLHDIASRREKSGLWMAKTLKMAKVLRPCYQRHLNGLWDTAEQELSLEQYDDGAIYITVL